jgi:hypothetical protein
LKKSFHRTVAPRALSSASRTQVPTGKADFRLDKRGLPSLF